jgi:hypothetical protein
MPKGVLLLVLFCCLTIASGFFGSLIVLSYLLDGWVLGFLWLSVLPCC